jgi:Domain of Unknown Function (DUF1080)
VTPSSKRPVRRSGFVTQQRRSSVSRPGFVALSLDTLGDWQMAGLGMFRRVEPGTVESEGGPGVLWYTREQFANFVLVVDWRLSSFTDNSGIFVRIPPLGQADPANDWRPAVDEGYEVQIDDRGIDPASGAAGSASHRTGAIYGRAPAVVEMSRPPGQWNTFEVEVQENIVGVRLNGVAVSRLTGTLRRRRGYVGLQAHHSGSRVQFRNLQVRAP